MVDEHFRISSQKRLEEGTETGGQLLAELRRKEF